MADQSVTYSLRHQARALAAQAADKFNSRWLVGTNSLKEENEVGWGFSTPVLILVCCVCYFDTPPFIMCDLLHTLETISSLVVWVGDPVQ